jgi:hypothetical protein
MPDTFRQSPYRNDPVIKGAALITGHRRYAEWFKDPTAPDYQSKVESYCRLTEALNNVPAGTRYGADGKPSRETERAALLRGGGVAEGSPESRTEALATAPRASLLSQAKGLVKHIAKEITDGGYQVPPEVSSERLAICKACPALVNSRCKLCGCYMPFKVTRSVAECPAKPPLWHAVGTAVPKEGSQDTQAHPVARRSCNGT